MGQPIMAEGEARAVTATSSGTLLVGYSNRIDERLVSPTQWLVRACEVAGRGLTITEVAEFLDEAGSRADPCMNEE